MAMESKICYLEGVRKLVRKSGPKKQEFRKKINKRKWEKNLFKTYVEEEQQFFCNTCIVEMKRNLSIASDSMADFDHKPSLTIDCPMTQM